MLLLLLAGAWGPLLHPPACQRLRDIPAPLFRPGNHPLSRLPGEAVSGGNVPSQRGDVSGSRPWLGRGAQRRMPAL